MPHGDHVPVLLTFLERIAVQAQFLQHAVGAGMNLQRLQARVAQLHQRARLLHGGLLRSQLCL